MRLTGYVFDIDELAADLASAVRRGELFAVFQPQVALHTGDIVAVEALARWRHPRLALVPPNVFIPLAERTGVIHELGRFMLDEGLGAAHAWRGAGKAIEVSVNVSPVQLTTAPFAKHLSQHLRRRNLPPHGLTIEITESQPLTDLSAIVPRLESLRSLGVGVSLDDFGVGHASAEQLDRLPVTELKLDRSLIHNDEARTALQLADTLARARERGLRVVAEGIETEAHLEIARSLGCDRAQGYLLGEPMLKADIDDLLAA